MTSSFCHFLFLLLIPLLILSTLLPPHHSLPSSSLFPPSSPPSSTPTPVPHTIRWISPHGGSFHSPLNWSPPRVPLPSSNVIISPSPTLFSPSSPLLISMEYGREVNILSLVIDGPVVLSSTQNTFHLQNYGNITRHGRIVSSHSSISLNGILSLHDNSSLVLLESQLNLNGHDILLFSSSIHFHSEGREKINEIKNVRKGIMVGKSNFIVWRGILNMDKVRWIVEGEEAEMAMKGYKLKSLYSGGGEGGSKKEDSNDNDDDEDNEVGDNGKSLIIVRGGKIRFSSPLHQHIEVDIKVENGGRMMIEEGDSGNGIGMMDESITMLNGGNNNLLIGNLFGGNGKSSTDNGDNDDISSAEWEDRDIDTSSLSLSLAGGGRGDKKKGENGKDNEEESGSGNGSEEEQTNAAASASSSALSLFHTLFPTIFPPPPSLSSDDSSSSPSSSSSFPSVVMFSSLSLTSAATPKNTNDSLIPSFSLSILSHKALLLHNCHHSLTSSSLSHSFNDISLTLSPQSYLLLSSSTALFHSSLIHSNGTIALFSSQFLWGDSHNQWKMSNMELRGDSTVGEIKSKRVDESGNEQESEGDGEYKHINSLHIEGGKVERGKFKVQNFTIYNPKGESNKGNEEVKKEEKDSKSPSIISITSHLSSCEVMVKHQLHISPYSNLFFHSNSHVLLSLSSDPNENESVEKEGNRNNSLFSSHSPSAPPCLMTIGSHSFLSTINGEDNSISPNITTTSTDPGLSLPSSIIIGEFCRLSLSDVDDILLNVAIQDESDPSVNGLSDASGVKGRGHLSVSNSSHISFHSPSHFPPIYFMGNNKNILFESWREQNTKDNKNLNDETEGETNENEKSKGDADFVFSSDGVWSTWGEGKGKGDGNGNGNDIEWRRGIFYIHYPPSSSSSSDLLSLSSPHSRSLELAHSVSPSLHIGWDSLFISNAMVLVDSPPLSPHFDRNSNANATNLSFSVPMSLTFPSLVIRNLTFGSASSNPSLESTADTASSLSTPTVCFPPDLWTQSMEWSSGYLSLPCLSIASSLILPNSPQLKSSKTDYLSLLPSSSLNMLSPLVIDDSSNLNILVGRNVSITMENQNPNEGDEGFRKGKGKGNSKGKGNKGDGGGKVTFISLFSDGNSTSNSPYPFHSSRHRRNNDKTSEGIENGSDEKDDSDVDSQNLVSFPSSLSLDNMNDMIMNTETNHTEFALPPSSNISSSTPTSSSTPSSYPSAIPLASPLFVTLFTLSLVLFFCSWAFCGFTMWKIYQNKKMKKKIKNEIQKENQNKNESENEKEINEEKQEDVNRQHDDEHGDGMNGIEKGNGKKEEVGGEEERKVRDDDEEEAEEKKSDVDISIKDH